MISSSTRSFLFWFRLSLVGAVLFVGGMSWALKGDWQSTYRGTGGTTKVSVAELNDGLDPVTWTVSASTVEVAIADRAELQALFEETNLIPLREQGADTSASETRVFYRVDDSDADDFDEVIAEVESGNIDGQLLPITIKVNLKALRTKYPGVDWSEGREIVANFTPASKRLVGLIFRAALGVFFLIILFAMYFAYQRQQTKLFQKIQPDYDFRKHQSALSLVSNSSTPAREIQRSPFPHYTGSTEALPTWRHWIPNSAFYVCIYTLIFGSGHWIHGEGFLLLAFGIALIPIAFCAVSYKFPLVEILEQQPPLLLEALQQYHASLLRELGFTRVAYCREPSSYMPFVGAVYLSRHGNVMVKIGNRSGRRSFVIISFLSDKTVLQTTSYFPFAENSKVRPGQVNVRTCNPDLLKAMDVHSKKLSEYLDANEVLECKVTPQNYLHAITSLLKPPMSSTPIA